MYCMEQNVGYVMPADFQDLQCYPPKKLITVLNSNKSFKLQLKRALLK